MGGGGGWVPAYYCDRTRITNEVYKLGHEPVSVRRVGTCYAGLWEDFLLKKNLKNSSFEKKADSHCKN